MSYTFIDFCAGIGCGRLGLERAGFQCIAFSEINKKAEETYRTFYGNKERNFGDLMKINTSELPHFDILIAGFPCQTFSVMGQRKGMEDPRGQIIFGIEKILREKQVKYFILENVKGLVNHEKGETIKSITKLLEDSGYHVKWQVLNTKDYGLPQSRERVYFFGIKKDIGPFTGKLHFPKKKNIVGLEKYLIETSDEFVLNQSRIKTLEYYLKNKYNKGLLNIEDLLKKTGYIIDTRQSDIRFYKGFCPTLRTGRHGLLYVKNGKLRDISGLEALLLQGVDYTYAIKTQGKISEQDILSQAGNAMSVNVIQCLGESLATFISNQDTYAGSRKTLIPDSKTMISEGGGYHHNVQGLAA